MDEGKHTLIFKDSKLDIKQNKSNNKEGDDDDDDQEKDDDYEVKDQTKEPTEITSEKIKKNIY
jgi:hypothetical protein